MAKIAFDNKQTAVDPANPQPNEKLTAANVNEIKTSVNTNIDNTVALATDIENLQDSLVLTDGDIQDLQASQTALVNDLAETNDDVEALSDQVEILTEAIPVRLNIRLKNKQNLGALTYPLLTGRFGPCNKGFSDGVMLNRTYQIWVKPQFNCTGIFLEFGNFTVGSPESASQATGLNPIKVGVSCSIEGNIRYFTFNGVDLVTISAGQKVKTDPLPYYCGTSNLCLLVYVEVANAGEKWPIGLTARNDGLGNENSAAGDQRNSGIGGAPDGSLMYHPLSIMATPLDETDSYNTVIYGDSIQGYDGDTVDFGWCRRGLDTINAVWVRLATGGSQMITYLGNPATPTFGVQSVTGAEVVINAYGANDLGAFSTLDQAKAAYLANWNKWAAQGAAVVQATVLPRNDWSTATKAIRIALNDWIRTKPAPLTDFLEAADRAETVRNSNVWKTGYTSDGTHPNVTASIEIAKCISEDKPGLFKY